MNNFRSFINELEVEQLMNNDKYQEALSILLNVLESGHYLKREHILNQIILCYMKLDRFNKALPLLKQLYHSQPEDNATLYNFAYSCYKTGLYKEALELFKILESKEGMTNDTVYHIALCYYLNGFPEKAKPYFEYLTKKNPAPDLIYNLGLELIQKGHAEGAQILYLLYLEPFPMDIDATFGLGIAYIEDGRYYQAIECLKRVISWDEKRYPSAYSMIGVAYFKINRVKSAFQFMQQAISHTPNSFETWYYLGQIYRETDNPSKAKEAFNKASRIQPKSVEVLNELASLAFKEGDSKAAQNYYKKAYSLQQHPEWAYQIALISMTRGEYEEAIRYFTITLERGNYNDVLENICVCYYHLGKYEKVIELLESREDANFDKGLFYFIYGSSLMKTGLYNQSREILEKGIKSFPSDINILYSLGLLEANMEHFKEASRIFEKALIIQRNPEVIYALALTKMQLDEVSEAIRLLEEYKLYQRGDIDALYKLGLLYIKIKSFDKARTVFDDIVNMDPKNQKAKQYLAELKSL